MKKLRLCLGLLMALALTQGNVNQLRADNVDVKTARSLAAYYMGVQTGAKNLNSENLTLVYQISNQEKNIPAMYFFNTSNGGYIVMSANEWMDPIIAYSTEGVLDPNNMPPSMMWYMNQFGNQIIFAQNNDLQPVAEVKAQWDELMQKKAIQDDAKAIYKTLRSEWNQDYPFNIYCPVVDGTVCPNGCVATAMSAIMHYWQYPVKPNRYRIATSNPNGGSKLEVRLDTVSYDWSLMPDTAARPYGNGHTRWTDEEVREVSKLTYHCGLANRMSYAPEGSGAVTRDGSTREAFYKYFKYDQDSIGDISRTQATFYNNTGTPNYKDSLWVDTLAREIKMKRPVFYCGYDVSSDGVHAGHAFIMEKFNTSTYKGFFNWGWAGAGNGWCNIVRNNLSALGYNFTSQHYCIIGIQPPADTLNARNQTVAIETAESEMQLMPAYPNPAKTWVTIPYSLGDATSATLQVYAIDGRMMEERTLYNTAARCAINVENYPKGIYIYRIGDVTRKFVVE